MATKRTRITVSLDIITALPFPESAAEVAGLTRDIKYHVAHGFQPYLTNVQIVEGSMKVEVVEQ